jgi:SARP family transcriptional regulator, regulator of embCAB operon
MDVSLLGPLVVTTGSRCVRGRDLGGAKPRGLLELLLLARGKSVSKDALADALWGMDPPNNVAGTIEQYVSLLRRRLFDEAALSRRAIVTEPQAYRIDIGEVRVDLDRFDSLVLRAEHADAVTRRTLLNDAVALAHGDLLEDAPYAPWAQWDRHVYRGRISRAHLALAHDSVMVGHYSVAVRHGEAALRFAPYSEQAFQVMMVSNYALGHTDQARMTFTRCREVAASLDVDPTTESVDIATAITVGTPPRDLIAKYIAPWWSSSDPIAPRARTHERSQSAPSRRTRIVVARHRPVAAAIA